MLAAYRACAPCIGYVCLLHICDAMHQFNALHTVAQLSTKKCIFAAKFYWMKHGVWNGDCPGFGFYVSQLIFCKDMRQKQFSPRVT